MMDFSTALAHLKSGNKVTRGVGSKVWVAIQRPTDGNPETEPYFYRETRDGHRVPWLPDFMDLMATDWNLA